MFHETPIWAIRPIAASVRAVWRHTQKAARLASRVVFGFSDWLHGLI
jgi:hypothetical protein